MFSAERGLTGKEFKQQHSKRENIAAGVALASLDLLRGHIGYGSNRAGRLGQLQRSLQLRQPEIHHFRPPSCRQHDVVGFDISVHDPPRMGLLKSFTDLDSDADGIVNPTVGDFFSQSSPIDEFHDDEHAAVIFLDPVDCADVWVIQRGRGFCLLEKTEFRFICNRDVGREELQSNRPIEPGILGLIDNAHAAFTELFNDSVVGNDRGDQGSFLYG